MAKNTCFVCDRRCEYWLAAFRLKPLPLHCEECATQVLKRVDLLRYSLIGVSAFLFVLAWILGAATELRSGAVVLFVATVAFFGFTAGRLKMALAMGIPPQDS